jgi:aryl-alcohol dehydrogenase-like predicted oxidoreductase
MGEEMKRVKLARTGEEVSQLCLGCMELGSRIGKGDSFALLDRFVEGGGNFLDTANCYAWWIGKGEFVGDESEALLGEWMKKRGNRSEIFLATKVGGRLKDTSIIRDESGEPRWEMLPAEYEHLAPATIRAGIEDSLRRLQTDHVDLYYAHIDDRDTALEDILGTMNELVEKGRVRYIACSNHRTWRLERARRISQENSLAQYVAVQQQYSYLRAKPGAYHPTSVNGDDELLDYLRANPEVIMLAYSPVLKGLYEHWDKRDENWLWPLFFESGDSLARFEALSRLARELGVTNTQLVLAWLLHHDPPVIPIVATSRMEQLEHNLAATEIELSPEQKQALDEAGV